MSNYVPFRPYRGKEVDILNKDYNDGYVYFATDTKKIYLDANGQSKLAMGGTSGIYYGNMELAETPDEGQIEFEFSVYDIDGNEDNPNPTVPNENDLILNKDGCFYRVMSVNNMGGEITLTTNKLTVAGSGGTGPGGPSAPSAGGVIMNRKTAQVATTLYQKSYSIGFYLEATDSSGEQTGNGLYEVFVGGVKRAGGTAKNFDSTYVDVGEFLALGHNAVKVVAYMDTGGSSMTSVSKTWQITTTLLELTWDYDETKINKTNEPLTLKWRISGSGIKKTSTLIIDDEQIVEGIPDTTGTDVTFVIDDPSVYNLIHGSHKFQLSITADVDGTIIPVEPIIKNLIFVEENNNSTIISCNFYQSKLTQYDTVKIPIIIYNALNIGSTESISVYEQGVEKDTWTNCTNQTVYEWSYTPTIYGTGVVLTIQSGTADLSKVVDIEKLAIDNEEVTGSAFKFKSNEFASNNAVMNWNSNNVNATFSDNFDWVNGGLKSEVDENGNNKQYVNIKAGSTMTINYPLFQKSAKADGKTIKVIFKATNCRDYDAQVLSCKRDKQVIAVDEEVEIFLVIDNGTTLSYSDGVRINNNVIELVNAKEAIFDLTNQPSRNLFGEKYIIFENKIYLCKIKVVEGTEKDETPQYYAVFFEPFIQDTFEGFSMNAQNATFNSRNQTISTQYCEDSYIELELDINKYDTNDITNYITFWIDGVPSGYTIYNSSDSFIDGTAQPIVIGSPDCDVQIYAIKVYENHLTDNEHLQNFIADAPGANEMIARYKRNDILDERGEISPTLLAIANPDCLSHVYTMSRMTKTKKDKVKNCTYSQYHNSDQAHLTADGVTIKVQGTSSEKYVVAAANLDVEFGNGFTDTVNNQHLDGWSMSENAIPINFSCTKVNVASCENANNALNQEWYNLFQPYKTVLRCKNPHARDCMEFTNGVLFIQDNNPTFTLTGNYDAKDNNIFGDTPGYLTNPYPKFYSLGQMGNSKKNVHVLHDTENPLECCVEVGDNQAPQQWMVDDNYLDSDIDDNEEYFGFRYPDGAENATQDMFNNWRRLVSWMAHSNPQPKYEKHEDVMTEKDYKAFAFNQKKNENVPVFILNEAKDGYISVTQFNPSIHTYYTETPHVYGYTDLPLSQPETYGAYTFRGYKANETIQKNYNPLIKGCVEDTYAGTYTTDCFERRMAKMLSECENYLAMDSIIYHFLFIERHCMIDNVAKNTFWSTEDGNVWNLTKNYDNDTADGNDNNGKFTRTYGMEPLDKLNANVFVFNAHRSVWFNFINGLPKACEHMYQQLENVTETYNGREVKLWNKNDYLWAFKEWQSRIPERCWIEDYYRKYHRPYEVYGDTMFNSMMEGGPKTHQRAQYETYQDIYMSSKYFGVTCSSSSSTIRGNGSGLLGHRLPITTYCDCYIHTHVGAAKSSQRVKRKELNYLVCPENDINNATVYFYPINIFSTIGSTNPEEGKVGDYEPEQLSFAGAHKLREFIVSTEDTVANESLKTGLDVSNNNLLEKLYVANLTRYEDKLDLTGCPNLKEVNATNSTFRAVSFADSAPVESIKLFKPTSLSMSNLKSINNFIISDYNRLSILDLNNIDDSPAVNSKDLVEKSTALENYRLTNVQWTLTNSDEITESTIPLLENLLVKNPIEGINGYEPREICLTGNLTVTTNAYNGTNAIDIYNKYAKPAIYPNLNIDFEGSNAVLYTVTIYDGNDNICWYRKTTPNSTITTDFLSEGPKGAFDVTNIYKASTAGKEYDFGGKWEVYDAATMSHLDSIESKETGVPVYNVPITRSLILKPVFDEKVRTYKLTFYDGDDTVIYTASHAYGEKLNDIIANKITKVPYKDDSKLSLYATWNYLGFGLTKSATNPVSENYTVRNEQSFYPVFEMLEDIRKHPHPEYFELVGANIEYKDPPADEGGEGIHVYGGRIKPAKTLRGKVVIPSTLNGVQIYSISGFNDGTQGVTHVFFEEKDCTVYEVAPECFKNVITLQYFDYSQNTIRKINNYAFQGCQNLQVSEFNNELRWIGLSAFNKAFKATPGGTLYIPPKVTAIYAGAFSVTTLPMAEGFKLKIGTAEHPSVLRLNKPSLTSEQKSKFKHEQGWSSIWISHQTYKNAADIAEVMDESVETVLTTIFGPNAGKVISFNA